MSRVQVQPNAWVKVLVNGRQVQLGYTFRTLASLTRWYKELNPGATVTIYYLEVEE